MTDSDDRRFAEAARAALRASEAQLDAVTAARLAAARHRALAAAETAPRTRVIWTLGVPAAALATALLAWVALPQLLAPPTSTVNAGGIDALEWAMDDADSEIVDNLDLYIALDDAGV